MKFDEFIKGKGMTRYSLSAVTGISQATLCRYAKGQRTPSLATLTKLAIALGTTEGKLIKILRGE